MNIILIWLSPFAIFAKNSLRSFTTSTIILVLNTEQVVSVLVFGRCSLQTPVKTPANLAQASIHKHVGVLSPVRLITASHSLTGTNIPVAFRPEMYHSASSTCDRKSSPSGSALDSYPWGARFEFRLGHRLTEALRGFPHALQPNLRTLPRLDYNECHPNNFQLIIYRQYYQ
jgi:hypothetical protein